MKAFGAGALVVLAMVMANVVAAGVMQQLAPLALEVPDESAQVALVAVAGVLAIVAALLFLKGCLRALIDATTMPGNGRRGG